MKFIRYAQKNRIRDRFFDLATKAFLIGLSVLACLWMISGAHAASITGIKAAQGENAYTIDFSLSEPLKQGDVQVEFERNFIQVSLKNVSAYPARTENVNHSLLEKVFTYQYQPDLARARVLLKANASTIKNKASWEITPQGLRITLKGAAPAAAIASDSLKNLAAASSARPVVSDTEEERIVQEILNESKTGAKAAEDLPISAHKTTNPPASVSAADAPGANSEEQPIFAAKGSAAEGGKGKENAATRIFASLLLVIGIIGAVAVAYRRFALGKGIPFQKQPKIFEIVASQSLGPKRSIALIKVLDQYMVIGMAGDSMSMLANLGADVKVEKFLDQMGGPGASFTDIFDGAMSSGSAKEDSAGQPIHSSTSHKITADLGIRSAIKKRMAGFKPL